MFWIKHYTNPKQKLTLMDFIVTRKIITIIVNKYVGFTSKVSYRLYYWYIPIHIGVNT